MSKNEKTLSIFVDESGIMCYPDPTARFYLVTLLLHDQDFDISQQVKMLDRDMYDIGIGDCFHAGPVIRREEGFAALTWELRNKIFARMMGFARHVEFKYKCIWVDKKFIDSQEQIVERLTAQLNEFLDSHREMLGNYPQIKLYYDCGQVEITNLLHSVLVATHHLPVVFAQNVRPRDYKLFQLADLICTVKHIELKLLLGGRMTISEHKFFGGSRAFSNKILRRLKGNEIL